LRGSPDVKKRTDSTSSIAFSARTSKPIMSDDGKQKRRRQPVAVSFTVLVGLRDDDNLHHRSRAGVDKHDVIAPEEILNGAATLHHDDIRR
jgi:hypothetical protein